MRAGLRIILVLLLLTPQCFSTSCRTCKNEKCFSKDIPLIKCNRNVPKLPIQELPQTNKESSQYGCLHLEYLNDNSLITLEQCIITEDINVFCTSIAKTAHVVQCIVHSPANIDLRKETLLDNRKISDQDQEIIIVDLTETKSMVLSELIDSSTNLPFSEIANQSNETSESGKDSATTSTSKIQGIKRTSLTDFKTSSLQDESTMLYELTSDFNTESKYFTTTEKNLELPENSSTMRILEILENSTEEITHNDKDLKLTEIPGTITVTAMDNSNLHEFSDVTIQQENVYEIDHNLKLPESDPDFSILSSITVESETTSSEGADSSYNDQEIIAESSTSIPDISDIDLKSTETSDMSTMNALDSFSPHELSDVTTIQQDNVYEIGNNLNLPESDSDFSILSSITVESETTSSEGADVFNTMALNLTTTEKADSSYNHQETITESSTSIPDISDNEGDLKPTENPDTTTMNALDTSSLHESSDVTTIQQDNVLEIDNNLNNPESDETLSVISLTTLQPDTTSTQESSDDLGDPDELTPSSIIPSESEKKPNSVSSHKSSFYIFILLTTISILNL